MSSGPAKVVVIGLDALERDLVTRWAAEGVLPNMAAMLRDCVWGETENPPGMEAGATWPSIFTGANPTNHGMYSAFNKVRAGTYFEDHFTPADFRGTPFWDVLSAAGRRVCVIDAPYTYVSTSINGIHVVDWGTHAPMSDIAHYAGAFQTNPPHLKAEIEARYGRDTVGFPDLRLLHRAQDFIALRDKLLDRSRRKTDMALDLMGRGPWDLFFVAYHEGHSAGHLCWHLHDPTHPRHDPALVAKTGNILQECYRATDAAVGRIRAAAGPEATLLVLLSHGMGTNVTGSVLLDEILLRLEGFEVPEGRNAVRRFVHASWLAMPMAVKDMLAPLRERLWPGLRDRLLVTDRTRRKCYEVRNNDATGGIRLNLKGREPEGQLALGAEADAFCARLTRDLLEIVNPATGRPAIARVLRTAEIFKGVDGDNMPDLLVDWNRDVPLNEVASPRIGVLRHKDLPTRTGDHRPTGAFFATGPGIAARRINEPTPVYALAPTITALLGVAQPGAEAPPIAALVAASAAAAE